MCDGVTGAVLADDAAHLVLDGMALVGGQAAVEGVVEAQVVGRHERAGLARRVPERVAQGPVQEVRAGVVAHRPGAPVGIDLGQQLLAEADAAMESTVVDDEPGHRPLRVVDREEDLAVRVAEQSRGRRSGRHPRRRRASGRARSERLGAASGAQLHVAAGLQLLVLDAVAHDGHDASWRRRRLVAQEGAVADPPRDAAEERRQLGLAGEVLARARAAALALPLEGGLEAVPVDADAVLGRELDGQVDGEAVRVVEPEGGLAVEARSVARARPPAGGPRRAPRRSGG